MICDIPIDHPRPDELVMFHVEGDDNLYVGAYVHDRWFAVYKVDENGTPYMGKLPQEVNVIDWSYASDLAEDERVECTIYGN